jgi:DNA-binding response OmpR family regulator
MKQTAIEQSTILLVDDTPENLEILVDTLKQRGFQLCLAKNGEAVFERLKYVRPDIILLDVLMPGMDGFEVCRRLKAAPDTQDIPVLFMTALPDVVDKVKGFEAGAVDYITKPFQQEEVLARIKAQLTIRTLQRELNEALVRRSQRQMEELRTNLSRSVPHELGTPLNIVPSKPLGKDAHTLLYLPCRKMTVQKKVGNVQFLTVMATKMPFVGRG